MDVQPVVAIHHPVRRFSVNLVAPAPLAQTAVLRAYVTHKFVLRSSVPIHAQLDMLRMLMAVRLVSAMNQPVRRFSVNLVAPAPLAQTAVLRAYVTHKCALNMPVQH
jgi:hypothetical protein